MFLRNNALLRRFHERTISQFINDKYSCREAAVQRLRPSPTPVPYKPLTLWSDTIPPPAAQKPALHSPWDEKRTKTDKLTVVCNLLVKAKWKKSTAAFNLTAEPCSSIFSSTFSKAPLTWYLRALLGGRLLVPNQVFISLLFLAVFLHTSLVLIQCTAKRRIKKELLLQHCPASR